MQLYDFLNIYVHWETNLGNDMHAYWNSESRTHFIEMDVKYCNKMFWQAADPDL